jgi:hypothetical protein
LIARLVSAEVRQLRGQLAGAAAAMAEADDRLADCQRRLATLSLQILTHTAGHPDTWWQEECSRLRRLCSAQEDLIARMEDRPTQAELPPATGSWLEDAMAVRASIAAAKRGGRGA